ncbi:glycosyltransferase [Pedobacter sp. ASV1-7]|uniref:glycosyltransferase n=1 Tax=Pedobacter sp. ASV1-7 TaxID=3145237 RepID=UPI0032E918DC
MKITIVIDAPHYIGGIRYIERFIKILSLTDQDIDLNIVYVNCKSPLNISVPKKEFFFKIPSILYRLDRLMARFLGISFFSIFLLKYVKNGNVFFSDIFLPKFLKKHYNIKLVHWFPDFQVYDLEHLFPKNKVISRKLYILLQLRTCDYLLTQSKTDLERMKILYPAFKDKIVKWSFAEPKFDVPEIDTVKIKEFNLPRGGFLMYPHQGWAHKNHLLLINILQSFPSERLVLTGRLSDPRNDKYSKDLQDAISKSKIEIINLGLVDSEELNLLMKNAKAILNFSSYEGWSSCVEEGIMFGTPLILSDLPIHREQFGDASFIDISTEESAKKTFAKALSEVEGFKGYCHGQRVMNSVKDLNDILVTL